MVVIQGDQLLDYGLEIKIDNTANAVIIDSIEILL